MVGRRMIRASMVVQTLFVLFAWNAAAQSQSGGAIGGVVKDTSGAVLPGVSVEASSPALIEKVRVATTDGDGLYRITNLSPGVYSVTFTLPGFSTMRREGVELTAGFTATINADLRIGALAETVLVTGQSPLVDVQNVTQQRTITTQLIAELPSARDASHMAVLIPGVMGGSGFNQDVGGTARPTGTHQVVVHGSKSNDWPNVHDGMQFGSMYNLGSGSAGVWQANPASVEEYAVTTSGAGADASASGVRINIIPKQGGNRFTGYFLGNFSNDRLLSSNVTDALVAGGVPREDPLRKLWDINPALGGPIRKDRLWFYFSYRYTGLREVQPNLFYDTNPDDYVFVRDTSRTLFAPQTTESENLRLTWQVTPGTKLALYGDNVPKDRPINALGFTGTGAYESTTHFYAPVSRLFQATYSVVRSKFLIEIGETYRPDHWDYGKQDDVPWTRSGIIEQSTNTTFRAPLSRIEFRAFQQNGKASVSYVTGAHNLKVGGSWFSGSGTTPTFLNNDSSYTFLNGVPVSLTLRATPFEATENIKVNLGIYAQEQWTTNRLTLNLGMRFDYLNGYIPEQQEPPVQFLPVARNYGRIANLPNQKDIVPRLGASYNLFGNGKTAIKFSIGKYLESEGVNIARSVNPMGTTTSTTTTRAWTDHNNDFVPDCDLTNPALNGECGPNSNANFGRLITPIRYADDVVTGWGSRGYNWEIATGFDHELRPGLSVGASYHRRWFGNLRFTDNVRVAPGDYNEYCITAPTNPRLPNSGEQVCGLFDIAPTLFGINDNVVRLASDDFGSRSEVFDGLDVNLNIRLPQGLMLQGGTSTGRVATNQCGVVDSPQERRFCNVAPPFQTQVKLLAIYPLPVWALQTSVTYQHLPGPMITASYAAPAAAVTGLGRPLSGGVRSVTVPLVAPGTMYGDALNQVDFRVTRVLRVRGVKVEPQFDLYNLFNANPILAQNNTYGPAWLNPLMVLKGRLIKVGAQLSF